MASEKEKTKHDSEYSDEFKEMLDKREQDYLNGSAILISAEEAKKRIQELLLSKK